MKRLKKMFLLLAFFGISILGFGQTETYFRLNGGHLMPSGYSPRAYGGVELSIKFDNNIGIHYTIVGGERYFSMPAGPMYGASVALFIAGDGNGFSKNKAGAMIFLGLLTALVPEGGFYDFEVTDEFSIAPYLSPFQYVKLKDREANPSAWSFAGSGGVRLHFRLIKQKLRFSPYCEYKIRYDDKKGDGIAIGASLGYRPW